MKFYYSNILSEEHFYMINKQATTEHGWNWYAPFTVQRHMHWPSCPSAKSKILASTDAWDEVVGTAAELCHFPNIFPLLYLQQLIS